MKEEGETDGLIAIVPDDRLGPGLGSKHGLPQALLGGDNLVFEPFVLGQSLYELHYQRSVGYRGWFNTKTPWFTHCSY